MQDILKEFINLLFPRLCVLCECALVKGEDYLCTGCMAKLPHLKLQDERRHRLYKKLSASMPLEELVAYLLYQKSGSSQKLLQLIKYRNFPELGIILGRHFGARLAAAGYAGKFDMIVPVPLHKSRLKQRGYNQSEAFAEGLAASLSLPLAADVVIRSSAGASQTRKSRIDRWLNVATSFEVVQKERLAGKRILLVDDVVTTGATLEACGLVLLAAGCAKLSVGAIAIA